MNMWDEKYQQKSKNISSAEPNYFDHFAMRYPVGEAIFDIPFMIQSHAESMKKILGAL